MIYRNVLDDKISLLGFGAMRLPTTESGEIDEAGVFKMVDVAIESGINYFDTAYPYHNGKSEIVNKDGYLFYTYNGIHYLVGYMGKETSAPSAFLVPKCLIILSSGLC